MLSFFFEIIDMLICYLPNPLSIFINIFSSIGITCFTLTLQCKWVSFRFTKEKINEIPERIEMGYCLIWRIGSGAFNDKMLYLGLLKFGLGVFFLFIPLLQFETCLRFKKPLVFYFKVLVIIIGLKT